MGHAIPKIHYNVTTMIGDISSGSDTITNIASTDGVEVGQSISGPNIPAGATVLSKTTLSIQMSVQATGTAAAQTIETYTKIEFDYPPVEPKGEKLAPQERRSIALSGLTQVSIDFVEGLRDIDLRFLSQTLFDQIKTFYSTFAVYGYGFRYYDDKTLSSYLTYELRNFDFEPDKIAPKGTNYVWAVKLKVRRVL